MIQLIQPQIVDATCPRSAVAWMRNHKVALPTWAELADPATISGDMSLKLKLSDPDAPQAENLWRVHWFNDANRRDRVAIPGHVVLPEAVTGVKAPIVALLGSRFPMIGAHKVLAAYACLVPQLVTGRFDPTRDRAI